MKVVGLITQEQSQSPGRRQIRQKTDEDGTGV